MLTPCVPPYIITTERERVILQVLFYSCSSKPWQFQVQRLRVLQWKAFLRWKLSVWNATRAGSQRNAPLRTSRGCVRGTRVTGCVGCAWRLWSTRWWDQIVSSPRKKRWTATSASAESSDHLRLPIIKQSTPSSPWDAFSGGASTLPGLSDRTRVGLFRPWTEFVPHTSFDRRVVSLLSRVKKVFLVCFIRLF